MNTINPRALEALKVWYAIFCAIMDTPPQKDIADDYAKLKKLRARIRQEAPELEAN